MTAWSVVAMPKAYDHAASSSASMCCMSRSLSGASRGTARTCMCSTARKRDAGVAQAYRRRPGRSKSALGGRLLRWAPEGEQVQRRAAHAHQEGGDQGPVVLERERPSDG